MQARIAQRPEACVLPRHIELEKLGADERTSIPPDRPTLSRCRVSLSPHLGFPSIKCRVVDRQRT